MFCLLLNVLCSTNHLLPTGSKYSVPRRLPTVCWIGFGPPWETVNKQQRRQWMNQWIHRIIKKKKKNAGSLRASCYIRKRPQVCYSLKKWRSGALLEGELIACNVSVISGRVRMWAIQNQFIYCLLCSYCCLLMSKEEFGKYLLKVF